MFGKLEVKQNTLCNFSEIAGNAFFPQYKMPYYGKTKPVLLYNVL